MVDSLTKDVGCRAQTALSASPIFVLRELHVEQIGDSLLLSGCVDTFYHKQLAQEVVRAVADGVNVENKVDVHGAAKETF